MPSFQGHGSLRIPERLFFGETALFGDVPRTATVQAVTPARVFMVPRIVFHRLLWAAFDRVISCRTRWRWAIRHRRWGPSELLALPTSGRRNMPVLRSRPL